jgi:hypothetical protein
MSSSGAAVFFGVVKLPHIVAKVHEQKLRKRTYELLAASESSEINPKNESRHSIKVDEPRTGKCKRNKGGRKTGLW